jgi:hypothetical protein
MFSRGLDPHSFNADPDTWLYFNAVPAPGLNRTIVGRNFFKHLQLTLNVFFLA